MSEENVEIVRQVFSEFAEGNFWVPERFDPNIRVVWLDGLQFGMETVGLQAMSDAMREWLQSYDEVRLTADRIIDAGEQVVVSATWHARGKTSGAPTEWHFGEVITLSDGRIASMVSYREMRDALEAAGPSE
jgi:ketosteroid isomerase-like protein